MDISEDNLPKIMKIHKVNSNTPIILDDDVYALSVLVTFDDEDISEAIETELYFELEEHAEDIINRINRNFEPLAVEVQLNEEEE